MSVMSLDSEKPTLSPQDEKFLEKAFELFRKDYRYLEQVLHSAHSRRKKDTK